MGPDPQIEKLHKISSLFKLTKMVEFYDFLPLRSKFCPQFDLPVECEEGLKEKVSFYDQLGRIYEACLSRDTKFLLGNLNTHISVKESPKELF